MVSLQWTYCTILNCLSVTCPTARKTPRILEELANSRTKLRNFQTKWRKVWNGTVWGKRACQTHAIWSRTRIIYLDWQRNMWSERLNGLWISIAQSDYQIDVGSHPEVLLVASDLGYCQYNLLVNRIQTYVMTVQTQCNVVSNLGKCKWKDERSWRKRKWHIV